MGRQDKQLLRADGILAGRAPNQIALYLDGDQWYFEAPAHFRGPSPWFDAKSFGARADGSNDDTAAVNAAIVEANAVGGTVYLGPGTWLLSSTATLNPPGDGVGLVLKTGTHLRGAGRQATIIKPTADNTSAIHLDYGATDITISDLTCDLRSVSNGETDGIKIVNNNRVHVSNVEVRGGRIGFQCIKSTDVQHVNCVARDQRQSAAQSSSAGFSAAENPTYNGDTRITYTNCISINSDDYGFTINGASGGNIITGVGLANCLVHKVGFQSDGSHTANTAGYAYHVKNAKVRLANCHAENPYQYAYLLQTGASFSRLVTCTSESASVGGASSGAGLYAQSGADDIAVIGCGMNATNGRGYQLQGTNRAQLIGNAATNSSGANGYGIQFDASLLTVVVGMSLNGNVSPSLLSNSPTFSDGFYGINPIARPLFATGASHTVDELITQLQALGLLRQS